MNSKRAVVFLSLFLSACTTTTTTILPEERERVPASVGPVLPFRLVCAGPATGEYVFSFSAVDRKLHLYFNEDGSAIVAGEAHFTMRTRGDRSDYDGKLKVSGSRTPDGRNYFLNGLLRGERLEFRLVRDGTGRLERIFVTGLRREEKAVYDANCQDVD